MNAFGLGEVRVRKLRARGAYKRVLTLLGWGSAQLPGMVPSRPGLPSRRLHAAGQVSAACRVLCRCLI
jgi:hypothetical protein